MKQEQIEALIQDMTLEEKLGQMTQLAPFFSAPMKTST